MASSRPGQTAPGDNSWGVRLNRWTLGAARHYLRIMLIVIGLYAFLPFAAPIFIRIGLPGPAQLIYNIYNPLCHQFAFRSWFLFGEQSAYPRAAANVPGLLPYENYLSQIQATLPADRVPPAALSQEYYDAKLFVGNAQMGYKIAVCQRDVGIYVALFTVGAVYAIPRVRRYLRPPPLWLYALLGLGPIGLDGFSQLLSQPPFNLWPYRESTPVFRLLTGALFGAMNGWLAFTYLESSAREIVKEIEEKFERRKMRLESEGRMEQAAE